MLVCNLYILPNKCYTDFQPSKMISKFLFTKENIEISLINPTSLRMWNYIPIHTFLIIPVQLQIL